MKMLSKPLLMIAVFCLTACALTPAQQAEREAKRVRAEQALQIKLAQQCDNETAGLIEQHFNPPLSQTVSQKADFEKRYTEKVNNPVFQACYKLALENYKAQEEIEYLRYRYYEDYPHFGWRRFCHSCW